MATSRKRGDRWEFCIRRKGVLPKPVYLSFQSQAEGDSYCARIERLLDSGVVPEELAEKSSPLTTIAQAHGVYCGKNPVSAADDSYWPVIMARYGQTKISTVDYNWVEKMVSRCKEEFNLSPSTIRHYVGALARLWDWLLKKQAVASNPFRALRRGYASGAKEDVSRDQRISAEDEAAILGKLEGDLKVLFQLALETAMRMREAYTLTADQVDIQRKTIFLDKTKNGDKRQVPLSSVAIRLLESQPNEGRVFPGLWNGSHSAAILRATTSRISVAFGRAAASVGLGHINFHDSRHEATCRLYERTKLSDVQISLITGHRDPRMLKRYANLRASDLAEALW